MQNARIVGAVHTHTHTHRYNLINGKKLQKNSFIKHIKITDYLEFCDRDITR